ncbi:Ig-like domain-containing protein [Miltoncostaea oceani]|uniref:Ig-like domain-containing protein n=1 Tax=Miltoncostaea oceani TaxID=2843216 RepID=UPI001C3D491B|nr:Ig-like domain-containing protein [Miltoncostaea oceani]
MSAGAVVALLSAAPAPALATRVEVRVVNDAAPTVRIVAPRDGARLVAGDEIVVRVETVDADGVAMAVDGTPTWSGTTAELAGPWTPAPGPHRLVAVAHRDGAPDAVARVDVVAVPAGPAAPGEPTPPAPPTPAAGTPGAPGDAVAPGGPVLGGGIGDPAPPAGAAAATGPRGPPRRHRVVRPRRRAGVGGRPPARPPATTTVAADRSRPSGACWPTRSGWRGPSRSRCCW